MASLISRNGIYYAQWFDANRRPMQRRHSLKTRSKRVAQKLLDAADDAYKLGKWDPFIDSISVLDDRPAEPTKLKEAVEAYLSARGKSLRPVTLKNYTSMLHRFAEQTGTRRSLVHLEASDVERFACQNALAKTTQRTRLAVLRAFMAWCVQEGWMEENPSARVDTPPQPARVPKAITVEELEQICQAIQRDHERRCGQPDRRLHTDVLWLIPTFRFALYTGLRVSELARLRWRDVDLDRRLLTIEMQKNRKAQTVPLSTAAVRVLEEVEQYRADDFVFCAPSSRGRSRKTFAWTTNVNAFFTKYRDLAEIARPLTMHSLRHGFCSILAAAGKSAFVIKQAARHANVTTSQVYVSLANEHLKAELDDVFS